jgi:hypothetical protein
MKNLKKNIRVIYLGMAVNYCHILTLEKVGFFNGFKMGNVNKKVWEIQTSNCILKIQKLAMLTKTWVEFKIVLVFV